MKALLQVGELYFYGNPNSKRDYALAKKYLELVGGSLESLPAVLSHEQGESRVRLGEIHLYGYGVDKNFDLARAYFESVANQAVNSATRARANQRLGEMDYHGYGTKHNNKPNFGCASAYLKLAANIAGESGNSDRLAWAHYYLGKMYFEGGDDIEPNHAVARDFLEVTRNHGCPLIQGWANFLLGKIYYCGSHGVHEDYALAKTHLEAVARQEDDEYDRNQACNLLIALGKVL